MFAKVKISGVLETITGLHIGGSSAFSAIGAVDSPVIRCFRYCLIIFFCQKCP